MKRLIGMACLSVVCGLVVYVGLSFMGSEPGIHGARSLRIALFTPATHLALEQIEQGFKETLQALSPVPCEFVCFNANGNRTLLRAQAEEIVGDTYDLVCTIGVLCSQTVAQLLHKKGLGMPHVFCAVDGPEFAHTLVAEHGVSTGVYVESNYSGAMDLLHTVKPGIKNILLVYDPTHGTGLERHKNEIQAYNATKFGTALRSVEIYHAHEIQQKVVAFLPSVDVVLILVDNTVVSAIDALVTLCNRYGVTLFASDLGSGARGAALAYGVAEYDSGRGAAQKAYAILVQGKNIGEVGVEAITAFKVAINQETMGLQGLKIDAQVMQYYTQGRGDHAA